jgi:hypothetical protein
MGVRYYTGNVHMDDDEEIEYEDDDEEIEYEEE